MRRGMYDLVVHCDVHAVRQHVDDAWLGRGFEPAAAVTVVELGLNLVFAFPLAAFFLHKKPREQSGGAAYAIETSGLAGHGGLAIDEAGKSITPVTNLDIALALQQVDGGVAGDLRRCGAFRQPDALFARKREIVFRCVGLEEHHAAQCEKKRDHCMHECTSIELRGKDEAPKE